MPHLWCKQGLRLLCCLAIVAFVLVDRHHQSTSGGANALDEGIVWFSLAEERVTAGHVDFFSWQVERLPPMPDRITPHPPRASSQSVEWGRNAVHVAPGTGGSALSGVWRAVRAGDRPDVRVLRTEELINHFHYDDYPPVDAANPFTLSAHLVPNPWRANTDLLHVTVQARPPASTEHPPTTLIVMIDVAGWATATGRVGITARAVRDLLPLLGSHDRIAILDYRSTTWGNGDDMDWPVRPAIAATERADVMRSLWRLNNPAYNPREVDVINRLRSWTKAEAEDGQRVVVQLFGSLDRWPDGPGWSQMLVTCCPHAARFDRWTDLSIGHREMAARLADAVGLTLPELGRDMRLNVQASAPGLMPSPVGYAPSEAFPLPAAAMRAGEQFTALFVVPRRSTVWFGDPGPPVGPITLDWTDPTTGGPRTLVLADHDLVRHRRLDDIPASTAIAVGLLGYSDYLAARQPGIAWPAVRHLLEQGSGTMQPGDDRVILRDIIDRTNRLLAPGQGTPPSRGNWVQGHAPVP